MNTPPSSNASPSSACQQVHLACAVIAGGRNRRMSGLEKCLLPLGHDTVLGRIVQVLERAERLVIINANGDLSRFSRFNQPKVKDKHADDAGPLNGVITCLTWLQQHRPEIQWLLTSAGDTPFLPDNYVKVFAEKIATQRASVFCATYSGQMHYLHCAWHRSTLQQLTRQKALGQVSMRGALALFEYKKVDFSHCAHDPFFNINTPNDYAIAKSKQ